jgi:hypothetical protein
LEDEKMSEVKIDYRAEFVKVYSKEPTEEELRVFTKYIDLVKRGRGINP